ncbi:MAG: hypothetical protein PVJ55_01725 [Anaerolineae bacterium]|jgi:hypothetical protein
MQKKADGASKVLLSLITGSGLAVGLLIAFSLRLPAEAQVLGLLVEPRSAAQPGSTRLVLDDEPAPAPRTAADARASCTG